MHRSREDPQTGGRYLFGVVRADGDRGLEGLGTFDDRRAVEVERMYGLLVITARVPVDGYGGAAVMGDPERLTALVEDHDRILRRAAERGRALVPVPFGTVLPDDELARRVEEQSGRLEEALDRLEGCDEYGVHVCVPREAAQRAVRTLTKNVHERLAACAEDVVIEPVAAGAREERPSVLSAAFLVRRDRRAQFDGMVRALREAWQIAGGTITTSGPWPAYHFTRVELGGRPPAGATVLLGPLSTPEHAWAADPRS